MKKNIFILLLLITGFAACVNDNHKQAKKLDTAKKSFAARGNTALDPECLKYIEAYKKWINDYVRAINIYTNDTSKMTSLNEYARLINVGKSLEMPQSCQTEKVFQDTILQITNRAKLLIRDRESSKIDNLLNP